MFDPNGISKNMICKCGNQKFIVNLTEINTFFFCTNCDNKICYCCVRTDLQNKFGWK